MRLELKEVRGFAGIINQVIEPLNRNDIFIEEFKEQNFKCVVNAPNLKYAALIEIANGNIIVQSIPNRPESNLSKKELNWDGYISLDSHNFLDLLMDRISFFKLGILFLKRQLKVRGIRTLLKLNKLIRILQFEHKI